MTNIAKIPPHITRERIDIIIGENADLGEDLSMFLLLAAIRLRVREVRTGSTEQLRKELSFLPSPIMAKLETLSQSREFTHACVKMVGEAFPDVLPFLFASVEALENL